MSISKAVSAGVWSLIDITLRQGVTFVASIALARLLMPADFGIMALLSFFASFSIVFVQGGLSTALIQRQQTSPDEESSVFWWNLTASLGFAGLLLIAAPFIAQVYGYPILADLMPFAAAQVVFSALGAVQTARLSRELRFRQLAVAGLSSSVISASVAVAAAWWGAGVWALAMQMATLAGVNSLSLWIVSGWRPNGHFRISTIKPLFGFGIHLSLSSVLDVVNAQGFALIVGKLHGVRDLGLFYRASGTQVLPSTILANVIGRVALPLFSARAHAPDALRRGARMCMRLGMLLNVPAMTGLVVLSDLVVLVLFGEKWSPAAPILSILSVAGMLLPLHVVNLQILLAQGRSDRYLRIELAKKVTGIPCIVIGSLFGIEGLAYSVIVSGVLSFFMNAYYTRKSLGYGTFAQLADVSAAFVPSLMMAFVVIAARSYIHLPPLLELITLVGIGGVVYCAMALLLVRLWWHDLQVLVPTWLGARLFPASNGIT